MSRRTDWPDGEWAEPDRLAAVVAVHEHALRRDDLARLLGMRPESDRFRAALFTAYRRRLVDMIGTTWVVSPAALPDRQAAERGAR